MIKHQKILRKPIKMTLKQFFLALTLLITLSFQAVARESVPIIEHNNIPVITGSGKTLTADQVRSAITTAAAANQWEISKDSTGDVVLATLFVRGKHTVVVSIPYAQDKFSINYQSSINMNYELSKRTSSSYPGTFNGNASIKNLPDGTPVIHPFYNKWVGILLSAIQAELKAH